MSLQKILKAISSPYRREILDLLKSGKMSAGEIVSHFDITNATISHHLSILKDAELIIDDKDGKFIYYELNMSVMEEIITWITSFKGGSDEK